MANPILKQILLITDGRSNKGIDPAIVAARAYEHDITVNVIGVADRQIHPSARREIEGTAEAGGGMFDIVTPRKLSQTMQTVTYQAMTRTIHQVIHDELRQLIGTGSLSEVPPKTRMEIIEKAEQIGEMSDLQILLLIDTSASMKTKITAVEQAIHDFDISLRSRSGKCRVMVASFPGKLTFLDVIMTWTDDLSPISALSRHLSMSGTTPTGPALEEALQYYGINRTYEHLSRGGSGGTQDYVF